jgi:hypothetical protein
MGRDDLWRLLAARTISRAIDLIRRRRPGDFPAEYDLEHLLAREPTPDEAAATADECRRLLDALEEPELRQIALSGTGVEAVRQAEGVPPSHVAGAAREGRQKRTRC